MNDEAAGPRRSDTAPSRPCPRSFTVFVLLSNYIEDLATTFIINSFFYYRGKMLMIGARWSLWLPICSKPCLRAQRGLTRFHFLIN